MENNYDEQQDDRNAATPSSSATWGFYDARTGASPPPPSAHRPRLGRTSSLPRAWFSGASTSIFGGAEPSRVSNMEQEIQQHDEEEQAQVQQRPTLQFTPPSQDGVLSTQPALSTLSGSTSIRQSEGSWYNGDESNLIVDGTELPQVEKSTDDVDAPPASSSRSGPHRRESTTLTTLSRLFAVQASTSPASSRSPSYVQQPVKPSYSRNLQFGEAAPLPDHLYSRGLLEGRHSDITVRAFGQEYKLHRLILDRAPFFRSALSEPWLEANARETTVHPEDIDNSITQASFELALKRLYGCSDSREESRDAVGLFATGCWLEMQDLIQSSIDSMLRQMAPPTLAPLIKLVTSNYYGRAGDRILSSAKAMLCRDGWDMPLRYWDGIPGDIVREIVGGDGFFIDGEWERWHLSKRILDRRLKMRAIDAGLVERETHNNHRRKRSKVLKAPDSASLIAIRFDTVYRKHNHSSSLPPSLHPWISLYTNPDIEPILVLLDEGIHYVHMDFEQLQFIRSAKDVLGLPVLPEKVVADALWAQMELRQRVLNAKETEMALGISLGCAEDGTAGVDGYKIDEDSRVDLTTLTTSLSSAIDAAASGGGGKGKHRATTSTSTIDEDIGASTQERYTEIDSGSWDANGKPRKFWIPMSDCNIVMGGTADPVIATSNNTTLQRQVNRLSGGGTMLGPEDIMWASDFAAVTSQPRFAAPAAPPSAGGEGGGGAAETASAGGGPMEVRYTHYPPFRFSASFPNPRLLKEKKRVYSRTVFYAGSLWNIYIQKVNSKSSKQLGVYLHRAKERDTEELLGGAVGGQGTVDERIGMLEREMLIRSERRERRRRRSDGAAEASEESAGDVDAALGLSGGSASAGETTARAGIMRSLLDRSRAASQRKSTYQAESGRMGSANASSSSTMEAGNALTPDSDDSDSESDSSSFGEHGGRPEFARTARSKRPNSVSTLPPYVDARPTIKTYFKIYSPSRGGRMLSVYESAPDRFNFSQSWGWKSSTLMLDEGLGGDEEDAIAGLSKEEGGVGGEGGSKGTHNDGRLRFMVVVGNI
ncbi:hypothetical protein LTR37_008085 [Vermiconidia calcicola]|uniref:Uncharacterized protein n=1 Tax=Vermiconidia calcicola TaxID=1690605 RepID=A0ACC3NEI8_9PEZI|nr:hypothetical protein LTR37_008085 [Vermiconidia calcicola]